MSKEGGVQRFERFLPREEEEFIENGISGTRRVVKGIKTDGSYAGEYILQKVVLGSQDSYIERHELSLKRPFNDTTYVVVFINGTLASLEGFGEELTDHEKHMYAGVLSHNFARSGEFIPPLASEGRKQR